MFTRKIMILIFIIAVTGCASAADDSYGNYPSPDELNAEIAALAEEFPEYVEVGEYGRSVQDRPLYYVRIARPGGGERAEALIAANIHGNEWIGNRVAMAAARRLLEDRDSDPWISALLDHIDFWVLPCINPDGYARTWEERANEKPRWAHMRKNANGVDLNRNFPLPAARTVDIDMAGSDDPEHIRYMGPYPYSEPESRAVRDFVSQRRFFAAIDFHSNWATFFPPKCNSSACEKQFRRMLEAAQARQPHLKYLTGAAWQIDSFSGEMEDTLFYEYGVMAVCWEVYPETAAREQQEDPAFSHPFWSMNPYDFGYWIENDRDAALAATEKAFEITGGRPVPEKLRKIKLD